MAKEQAKKNKNSINNKTKKEKHGLKSIRVSINYHYYDDEIIDNDCYSNEASKQDILKKLYESSRSISESDLKNFSNIKIFHFRKDVKDFDDKNGLIYDIKIPEEHILRDFFLLISRISYRW